MRMKMLMGLGLALLLPACCFPGNPHHPHLTRAEQLELKTIALVRWIAEDADGDNVLVAPKDAAGRDDLVLQAYCAGTWIANDVFITAAHCVDDIGETKEHGLAREALGGPSWDPVGQDTIYSAFGDVSDAGGNGHDRHVTHPCRVMSYDEDTDLALVYALPDTSTPIPKHIVASLTTHVNVGDDIDIVGHPVGMWWTYTHGWIGQVLPNYTYAEGKTASYIQVSATIWYGNSGGGVFNEQGELVSVISKIRRPEGGTGSINMGLTVPFFQVRQHLKKHGISGF